MILAESDGVGDELARQLHDGGLRVVVATMGADYADVAENHYTLRPDADDHFARLLANAFSATSPAGVVYLGGLDAPEKMRRSTQNLSSKCRCN